MTLFDKSQKYEIVGSPKCGTSSLGEYMRRQGIDVIESELRFLDTKYAENFTYERTPVIITRDVKQRNESDALFFDIPNQDSSFWSQYEAGIEMYDDPIVLTLEEMKNVKDFPHHNRNMMR